MVQMEVETEKYLKKLQGKDAAKDRVKGKEKGMGTPHVR